MMKRIAFTAVLLCILAAAPPVMADFYGGEVYWTRVANHYSGNGGEFTIYYNGPAVLPNESYADVAKAQDGRSNSFQTFCVELSEYLQTPMDAFVSTTYADGTEGWTHAIKGGGSFNDTYSPPLTTGDDLEPTTAYLYTLFASGKLSNYQYSGAGRATSAGTLQKVIWYLEGEIGNLTDSSGGFLLSSAQIAQANAWITQANNAVNSGAWSGLGQVRVLNMWGVDPTTGQYVKLAQDQLYVPIPAALLLGMLGLGAAGLKLRKFA
jgi:hypothetical protein